MYRAVGVAALVAVQLAGAASQVRLQVQLGHASPIHSVAFSPDGRWVLTGSQDNSARLWDIATGREIRRFQDPGDVYGEVYPAVFSPDGRFVATGDFHRARLWDAESGQEVRRFEAGAQVFAIAFSADGKRLLTGAGDGTARLWDADTGQELLRCSHPGQIFGAALSADGRWIVTGSEDHSVRLYDAVSGGEVRRFDGHTGAVAAVAISHDGKWIVSAGEDQTARVWDRETGREVRRLSHAKPVHGVAISPDDRLIATAAELADTATLWDAATGREVRRWERVRFVDSVAFSRDGHSLLTGGDHIAQMWDVDSGRELRRFTGHARFVDSVAIADGGRFLLSGGSFAWQLWDLAAGAEIHRFSNDYATFSPDGQSLLHDGSFDQDAGVWNLSQGRDAPPPRQGGSPAVQDGQIARYSPDGRLLLVTGGKAVILKDAATGREIRRLDGSGYFKSAAFSPDSRLVTAADPDTTHVWEIASGREIQDFKQPDPVNCVAFSPDGKYVFTGAQLEVVAALWDVSTGAAVQQYFGHRGTITSAAFSPDGRTLLTGSSDRTARLWDVVSGAPLREFAGHSAAVSSVAFSPDGRFVVTGSDDGTNRIWDAASGRYLASLISFEDGGWAVVDPEGRYDASDPDNSPGLNWQLGDEVIELRQLKARFYTPNLLARILGFNREPLPRVAGLDQLQPWPAVQVRPPQGGQTSAMLELTDRGGGVGRVVVKVNGREIPLNTRGAPVQSGRPVTLDLSSAQLAADGKNTIEVIAYDGSNVVAGRGVRIEWDKAPENRAAAPALHAILAGASSYENPSLSLRFPAKDALDMAAALEVGGKGLFGVDHVDIARFATGSGREPTKQNIRQAFLEVAAKAGPNDVLLVYFAGHGVAGAAGSDLYYYLTRDARTTNPEEDPQLWRETTISSAELLEWLRRKGMPLRQVVVLDTCAAGAAISSLVKLADRRELTADQRRALELLKDATGSHILMGAAADKVSYEASRYGQGLLTYSLLQGMRGEALDDGGRLDVANWFRTAQREVPELARGIGGIQQPVISSPGGQTFPIGLFTAEARKEIVLPGLKAQLLRARVEDEDQNDPLALEEPVRALLRAASFPVTRGESRPDAPLVYLDQVAGDVAGAYVPQIRYRVNGGSVEIRIRLVSGQDRKEETVTAPSGNTAELAKRIVEEVVRMAGKLNQQ